MAQNTVIINNVVGTAWLRLVDGGLQPLKEGMHVSTDAEIVTGDNTQVELQSGDEHTLVFGANREILLSPSLFDTDIDISEFQVSQLSDTTIMQVLATLDGDAAQALSDSTDINNNFVLLLSRVEPNTPVALRYPDTHDDGLSGLIESAETVVPNLTEVTEKPSFTPTKPDLGANAGSDILNTVAQDFINESLNKGSDS